MENVALTIMRVQALDLEQHYATSSPR